MRRNRLRTSAPLVSWITCLLGLGVGSVAMSQTERPPDFARDVRPILAQFCFKCHGPDDKTRKAGLRLDDPHVATQATESGGIAIVPGQPDNSELVIRVLSDDPNEVMPPPATKFELTAAQKETLRRWVASGAEYRPHWAFVAPQPAPLPKVQAADWPRNAIDYFVLAKLEASGMAPSPEADKRTLIRRVSLDLIGLPPTPEEVREFEQDTSGEAYSRLVDRLLASQQYGERWARRWLDLARYADTNGYEKDRARSIWPYRDWVINAINNDMPFDQFTIEQLAGDLLPEATLSQRVATGFHRNTMLNEEGGIDPLEFRFHAMTDRIATTGTTWLGLTIGCAQCHTHKFDPIPQREYYSMMAFLNNADEPDLDLPRDEITQRRAELQARIATLTEQLPEHYPVEDVRWSTPWALSAKAAETEKIETLDDGSVRLGLPAPDKDTFTLTLEPPTGAVQWVRLEVLTDDTLPAKGPGRAPNGNFVLNEFTIETTDGDQPAKMLALKDAEADFSQDQFPVANAIDGKADTGWAIWNAKGNSNVPRTAKFTFAEPPVVAAGTKWTIRMTQNYGGHHTLGRFRISFGSPVENQRPVEVRRQERLLEDFTEWLTRERKQAVRWTVLNPTSAKSNLPHLTIEDEGQVFVSGDMSKSDTYRLTFNTPLKNVTAFRLDALPDDRLPAHGPGRIYYEGPKGDFFLSEFRGSAGDAPFKFSQASQSFASGKDEAPRSIDGDQQTGWSINGGQGRDHHAVFKLAEPLTTTGPFQLEMLFERYYAAGLGKFRISVTTDPHAGEARNLPAHVEQLLLLPEEKLTNEQRQELRRQFLLTTPALAAARKEIDQLRGQIPAYPTTLVFVERPAENPRPTFIHNRGEFLKPTDEVAAATLSFLPPLPAEAPRNRLSLARWLVAPENPLTARVIANRHWGAFFGRGLVRTTEDFGYQGELPSHPALLDWLALEFRTQGWSLKRLHKLIVMSATYRQSSHVTPESLQKDPENVLLGRGPRIRLEAELVRDSILRVSGLLSTKVGGPSVFPPQPTNVTTEGTYGALGWNTSPGEDRYRRSLYTFSKRTAPFAMLTTFDGPSGEACIARRDSSNTPLQALTLLNDGMFEEAAQALGRRYAEQTTPVAEQAADLFRRCLVRDPEPAELQALVAYFEAQRQRLATQAEAAKAIAGEGPGPVEVRAAWTLLARVLFNLDEMITKN